MKNYTSAPLPFSGQKRRFAGKFKESLKEVAPNSIVVDLFGGSGLLSHFAKTALPNARVIYNDFDNYTLRLKNIENTNKLLSMIRHLLGSTPGNHKIPSEIKNKILDLLKENEDSGMIVDYHTISSNLMFSNNISLNFDEFRLHNLYNKISKNDYNCEGYLKGVEVVSVDYKVLFNKYKENENVFFIFDPPYLNTLVESYAMNGWSLATYLDVLKLLKNCSFFFFTSSKSDIVDFCTWLGDNTTFGNPFSRTTYSEIQVSCHSMKYTDMMFYKI